jgi:hypothetical protein
MSNQIAIDFQFNVLISTNLATKDPPQNASYNAKLVLKASLNAACKNSMDDATCDVKPYQINGTNFLLLLYCLDMKGTILANEMDLEKIV